MLIIIIKEVYITVDILKEKRKNSFMFIVSCKILL